MKKVLLIGKFNDITRELSNCLSGQFQVQLCSEDFGILKGMLKMTEPDLFVVSLTGSAAAAKEMFGFLRSERPGKPLLGIGSASDQTELVINGYLAESWTRFLSRPAKPEDVLRCARELTAGDGSREPDAQEDGGTEEQATILLVDDSPTLLRAMQAMLSKKYKVMFATSGTQAIASVARNKPDLILLDYEMPVCDGKMTLEMLRSEEDMKDIPVVFLTGMADEKHVRNVMGLHPQGYLLKPCSEEMLFSAIGKVLGTGR